MNKLKKNKLVTPVHLENCVIANKTKTQKNWQRNKRYRTWKAGKNWLYSASIMTAFMGGGGVVFVQAVTSSTTVSSANSTFSLESQATSLYQTVQAKYQAANDAVNAANASSATVKTASDQVVSATDMASQVAELANLTTAVNQFNTDSQTVKSKVDAYQVAINAYNQFISTNNLSTTQLSAPQASTPDISTYMQKVADYQTKVQDYIQKAQSVIDTNVVNDGLSREITSLANAVNSTKADLDQKAASLNAGLATLKDTVNSAASYSGDSAGYKAAVAAAQKTAGDTLAAYQTSYKAYDQATSAYQAKQPAYVAAGGTATPLPDLTATFDAAYTSAQTVITNAETLASKNGSLLADASQISKDWQATKTAYDAYAAASTKQNEDQALLTGIVNAFPSSSATAGEPTASTTLANWEAQYNAAVAALQADISGTNAAQSNYASALQTYTSNNSSSPLYTTQPALPDDGTDTSGVFTNPVQTWLNTLQYDGYVADSTADTNANAANLVVVNAVNQYLTNQTLANTSNNVQALHDRAAAELVNLQSLMGQISSIYNQTNQLAVNIVPGDYSTVMSTALNWISTVSSLTPALDTALSQLVTATSQAASDYKTYTTALSSYNNLPEVLANPSYAISGDTGLTTLYNSVNSNLKNNFSLTGLDGQPGSTSSAYVDAIRNALNLDITQAPTKWFQNLATSTFYPYDSSVNGTSDAALQSWMQSIFTQNGAGDIHDPLAWQKIYEDLGVGNLGGAAISQSKPTIVGKPTGLTPPPITPLTVSSQGQTLTVNPPNQPNTPGYQETTDSVVVPSGQTVTTSPIGFSPITVVAPVPPLIAINKVYPTIIPSIDVEKTNDIPAARPGNGNYTDTDNNLGDTDHDTPDTADQVGNGETTKIYFRVTDNGTDDLKNVTVSDRLTTDDTSGTAVGTVVWTTSSGQVLTVTNNTLYNPDGSVFILKIGDYVVGSATLPALAADKLHGDEITVGGTGVISGKEVGDHDKWYGETQNPKPIIDIEKSNHSVPDAGQGNNEDKPNNMGANDHDTSDTALNIGSAKTLTIAGRITNKGTEALTHIKFIDKQLSGSVHVQSLKWTYKGQRLSTNKVGEFITSDGKLLVLQVGESVIETTGELANLSAGEVHGDEFEVTAIGVISGKTVGDHDDWFGERPSPVQNITKVFLPKTGDKKSILTAAGSVLIAILLTIGFVVERKRQGFFKILGAVKSKFSK